MLFKRVMIKDCILSFLTLELLFQDELDEDEDGSDGNITVLTKRAVYDWYIENKNKSPIADYWRLFSSQQNIPENACNSKSFSVKIMALGKKVIKLRGTNKEKCLEEVFNLPKEMQPTASCSVNEALLKEDNVELRKERVMLKRKLGKMENLEEEVQVLKSIRKELGEMIKNKVADEKEIGRLRKEYKTLTERNESKQAVVEKLSSENINLQAKVRRREKSLDKMGDEVTDLISNTNKHEEEVAKQKLEMLEGVLNESKCEMKDLKIEKKRLSRKVSMLKEKMENMKVGDVCKFVEEIDGLTGQVTNLKEENKELQQLIGILSTDELVTFENGRFTDNIREAVMKLVDLNVSIKKVDLVIKAVLGSLTEIDVNDLRLPSVGARKRMVEEALCLAQFQVAEEMQKDGDNPAIFGNCLHGDGTTKYSKHYQNFQITTRSGKTLSLGLSEVADADAAAVLKTFTDTMDDLADVVNGNKEKDFAALICSIKNTMSDMGPVNPLFNRKLKAFREELLPTVIENWDELEMDQREKFIEMGHFFCKLHLLVNFATETDKLLKEFENAMIVDGHEHKYAFVTKESSPVMAIRLSSKALHDRGCDKSGVASLFNSYLDKKSEMKHIVSFISNRFNILFFNAGAVYYHHEDIKDFLSTFSNPNRLLLSLNELLQNKFNLACIRALGIAGKLVTSPFWRLIEHCENILSMNQYLDVLKHKLVSFSENARPVMEGATVWDESDSLLSINKDDRYEKLFVITNDEEFETLTIQALEQIFLAFLIILERQGSDQLVGGKYSNPSDEFKESSSNVPAHNKASESDFGLLDLLMRLRPNANVETMQALIMWSRNKTASWLDEKSEEERRSLIEKAMLRSTKMHIKYKDRKEALKKRKIEILQEQIESKKLLEEKRVLKKVKAVDELKRLNITAWLSKEEAREKLAEFDEKSRQVVVEAQLEFYKDVLLCERKTPRTMFTKSEKNEGKLSCDRLFEKLENAIDFLALPDDTESAPKKTVLKPREEREEIYKQHKEKQGGRMYNDRLSAALRLKNEVDIPKVADDPKILVNCFVQHKVRENDQDVWLQGEVIGIDRLDANNPHRTNYEIIYKDDDNVYTSRLIKDMEKGDCFVQIAIWK